MQRLTRSSTGRSSLVLGLVLLAAGCGNGPATPVAATGSPLVPATTATPGPAATPGPTRSPGPAATPGPVGGPTDRPDLGAVRVATRVEVDGLSSPLEVATAADGTGRLFVVEQTGRIRIVQDGQLVTTPYLDISDRVQAGGERGLLGVAFPPGFGDAQMAFFVHYSDTEGNTTVSSFQVASAEAPTVDPASERVILTQAQPYSNHNGGWIGFDPDGMLLIALGDGGSGGDPQNHASSLDSLLGKMLRIDVLGATGSTPYLISGDNPFVGRSDARPEILHYGLRNPFRDSIDPATGNLWIGDVGQDAWEEIDVAPAGSRGLDFGWHHWEGRHCYDPPSGCDPAGVTMPVTEYGHGSGCAVIGGVVYRGSDIPALRGAYLFSDNCSGTLWAIDAGLDAPQAPITLLETGRPISSIGTDDAGEVYLTDLSGGALLRLVPAH
jgi:glucose/arabinose dehydrogenase